MEDAEDDAPQGWQGTGKPMASVPGMSKGGCTMVKACARQAPGHQKIASILRRSLWASISRLILRTAEFLSTVQLLSAVALGRLAKSPFSQDVVERLRSGVNVILAREGIQCERVEGDRTDVPINFRLLGWL